MVSTVQGPGPPRVRAIRTLKTCFNTSGEGSKVQRLKRQNNKTKVLLLALRWSCWYRFFILLARSPISVYITKDEHWNHINEVHKDILLKECRGKVLDAGCGYGRWSELFEDYVGVDFSPDFIDEAKRKYPSKNFIVADLKDLPFNKNEFDIAFCVSIKQMVRANLGDEEWNLMLKELKRVAKKVLILEYEDPKPFEVI